jgi:SAM-dependent methyltransferase
MGRIESVHESFVYPQRIRILADLLARLIPPNSTALDVGCGDGLLDSKIMEARPDTSFAGIDVLARKQVFIPVTTFDGRVIPHADASFDVVMLVDVLHHTHDPMVLLLEATRVASKAVVIKDHLRDGFLAKPTLRLMDWVGNARHGVSLPYNYWPEQMWHRAFKAAGLSISSWNGKLKLYPWWADWWFGRSLHFVARLVSERTLRAKASSI